MRMQVWGTGGKRCRMLAGLGWLGQLAVSGTPSGQGLGWGRSIQLCQDEIGEVMVGEVVIWCRAEAGVAGSLWCRMVRLWVAEIGRGRVWTENIC